MTTYYELKTSNVHFFTKHENLFYLMDENM
jgi:hypothetical protein